MDYAIGQVNFVDNLPDGPLKYSEVGVCVCVCGGGGGGGRGVQLQMNSKAKQNFLGASNNESWASTCQLQFAQRTSCKTDFLCPSMLSTNL